jgi:tripartite ATP-independent transporter DctP family solute receptor
MNVWLKSYPIQPKKGACQMERKASLRAAGLILVLSIFTLGFAGNAFGAKVLKLAHLNPPDPFDNPTAPIAAVFKNVVESRTNQNIKVELYAAGVLGKERESMEQVQQGVIQSYIASGTGISQFYQPYDVTNLPFAFNSYAVAYEVYDGPFGQEMGEDIRKKTGFKVLGYGESGGFFQISNSKRPIKSPADMKGLKIRTMSIPIHMGIIESLGGAPTPIAWAEVYTALQTGVVDGQMNPIPIINTAKFYEVQKFITLTNHLYAPYVWVLNDKWYQGLTAAEKEIVMDAAKTALVAGRGLNRIIESSDKGLPVIAKRMQVYTPTADEFSQFRTASIAGARKIIADKLGEEGKTWTDKFLKAIEAAEKKLKP